jgi:SAM-dependent methyltransferase
VAERKAPHIDWRQGQAEALPFEAGEFDAVVSQFGLMFFEDRQQSIREMARVLRPDGRLAVAVWDSYANGPGYAALVGLLARMFGESVADELRRPFVLGETQELERLFAGASMRDVTVTTQMGVARFPSLESWIYTEICGWTLVDAFDDAAYQRLLAAAAEVMQPFVSAQGAVSFPVPAHIVSATKS